MARFQVAHFFVGFLCLFVYYSRAGLVSVPFDNFHIECPQSAGVQRLSIRMVESQGMKRQDTVFSISCNSIKELYPWNGIPAELSAIDREDCHYSKAFDPIMDASGELSCGPREYIASVVRLYGTKIQVGCCKLRTREETNCIVQRFSKPFGLSVRTEIENRAMLINSIAVDGNFFRVRFCDLTPRAAGLIVEDAKKAALRTTPTTSTSTTSEQTSPSSTTTVPVQTTQTIAQSSEPTEATSPKRIIKVKQQKTTNQTLSNENTSINLPTILQPPQPAEIDANQIVNVQRSLHGTSIVDETAGHKAKDAPQGLAKIADNDSGPATTTTSEIEQSTTSEPVQQTSKANSETAQATLTTEKEEVSSTKAIVEETVVQQETTQSLSEVDPTTSATTIEAAESEKIEPETTVAQKVESQTTASKIEATTEEVLTTKSETSEPKTTVSEVPTDSSTIAPSSAPIQEQTSAPTKQPTEIPSEESEFKTETTKEETQPSTSEFVQTTSNTNSPTKETTIQELPKPTTEQAHKPQFIATDAHDTETMFPKMPVSDYDESEEEKPKDKEAEADKIMKSVMQMMDARQEIKKLEEELKEQNKPVAESPPPRKMADSEVRMDEETTTTESSVLIVARKDKKPTNDGQTKMDANKPEKRVDFVQADQKPLADENINGERKKLDEFVDRAAFDFSAFPQPKDSEPVKEAAELPRYTRVQTKATTKLQLPLATTTKEPEYLVADRLDDIPEPISLKPRRNLVRTSNLRRRPVSHYPDEETNNSPFDENAGASSRSDGRQRKTDSGFAEENVGSRHDLFDQEGSFEQTSEGRFSLPTDSRFSQRSPFEVRRAPIPHLKEPYYSFDIIAEKYAMKSTQRPQSVDILFESVAEESSLSTTTSQTSLPSISHHDAERFFHPPDNKPMKAPEPSMFASDDPPKKLTFLRKKQRDPMKIKPLPDASNHLVPMSETPSSAATLLPVEPTTRPHTVEQTVPSTTPSTTETSTTIEITPPIETVPTTREFIFSSTESTTLATEPVTEPLVEQTPDSSTKIYNPLDFYHTIPPRREFLREKILTFCSKETAIRDSNHMVIACGVESEVWQPNRCPDGTDCFTSSDSTYRICCPVQSK